MDELPSSKNVPCSSGEEEGDDAILLLVVVLVVVGRLDGAVSARPRLLSPAVYDTPPGNRVRRRGLIGGRGGGGSIVIAAGRPTPLFTACSRSMTALMFDVEDMRVGSEMADFCTIFFRLGGNVPDDEGKKSLVADG